MWPALANCVIYSDLLENMPIQQQKGIMKSVLDTQNFPGSLTVWIINMRSKKDITHELNQAPQTVFDSSDDNTRKSKWPQLKFSHQTTASTCVFGCHISKLQWLDSLPAYFNCWLPLCKCSYYIHSLYRKLVLFPRGMQWVFTAFATLKYGINFHTNLQRLFQWNGC